VNYARFTALRRPACEDFERRLAAAQRRASSIDYDDLEELAFQYRQLLHDHALAAARFPGTAIARRLHALVLRATHWLQRDPGDHLPSPVRFVNQTFPRAFRKQRSLIALSAVLFALGGLVGVCLTAAEPAIASVFLGPDAIDGLREGRIWTESIFAVTPGSVASTRIATNNMAVAMTGWAGGALAGLFGIYVLVLNGLMLGAVVTVTMHYSMAPSLLDFVAAHGPLEITLILVSTAAGLAIGRAIVVAGDRPRAERLREASRGSLVVLLGCLPWIVLSGFVEGFISPAAHISTGAKAVLGLLLWGAFLIVAWNPFLTEVER